MKNLPDISRKLTEAGMPGDTPAALVRWGTTVRHKSLTSTIAELPEQALRHGFSAPGLIVVGGVVSLHDSLNWFEKRPLYGKSVVVTRAREQASDSAALLENLGAEVIQFPTICIRPVEDHRDLDAAIANLESYRAVVFTSVNGVRLFWERLDALGLDGRAFRDNLVAAIGPATAEALRSHGIRPDFVPESYVAESVAEGLCARLGDSLAGSSILLPRARVAREILPDTLQRGGARVHVLPVYETVPAEARRDEVLERLEAGTIDCVTFGSSSTVDNFLSLIPAEVLQRHPAVKLACIGPITAATLEKAGLVCHIQPADYTIPGLARALTEKL